MVKNLPANAGALGSIPGLGRSPGGGNGNPTLVFLLGQSHRQRSLVSCSPRGPKESDTTEHAQKQFSPCDRLCLLFYFIF